MPSAANLPAIVADSASEPVPLFPRQSDDREIEHALLRSPTPDNWRSCATSEVASVLTVPIVRDGEKIGAFRCDNRIARPPSFELHAAAELFAQVFAMQLPG